MFCFFILWKITFWDKHFNILRKFSEFNFPPGWKALNSTYIPSYIFYQRYMIPQEILLTKVEKESFKNYVCCPLTSYFIFNFLLSHSKKAIIFACTDTILFTKGMVSYLCPCLLIYCLSVKLRCLFQDFETQKGCLLHRIQMLVQRKFLLAFMLWENRF